MNFIQPNPSANKYPNLQRLVAGYLGEDWFYINSFLLDPDTYEHKEMSEVNKPEIHRLLELVIDYLCKNRLKNKELIEKSIKEIDKVIADTPDDDRKYIGVFFLELHMPNLPLDTWQEHKQFLLHLKEKLQATLLENPI